MKTIEQLALRRALVVERLESRINFANISFESFGDLQTNGGPYVALEAFVNDDEFKDVISLGLYDAHVRTWLGDGNGALTEGPSAFALPNSQFPFLGGVDLAAGDVDNDGDIDVATANGADGTISVLLNDGQGVFTLHASRTAGTLPEGIALLDVDSNGFLDVAAVDVWFDSSKLYVFLGATTAQSTYFISETAIETPIVLQNTSTGTRPIDLAVGDFNEDNLPDLVTADYGTDSTTVLVNNGSGGWSQSNWNAGIDPVSVTVADFNSDGVSDYAVSSEIDNQTLVMLNNRDGSFTQSASLYTSRRSFGVTAGDLNNDGFNDVIVADRSSPGIPGEIFAYMGDGQGNFPSLHRIPAGSGSNSPTLVDLNSDGYLDIVTANIFGDQTTISTLSGSISINLVVGPIVALPGGPYEVTEGTPLPISASIVPGNRLLTYAWDFGDGNSATGASVSHTYLDNGIYEVVLTVTDAFGNSATGTTSVEVTNVSPVFSLDIGNSLRVAEGTGPSAIRVVNIFDPSEADRLAGNTYAVDVNNDGLFDVFGGTDGTIQIPSNLTADGPRQTDFLVRVTDKDGGYTEQVVLLLVDSVAPTVTVSSMPTVLRGNQFGLTLFAADPSEVDREAGFNYGIDWEGDGTFDAIVNGPDGTFATHRYLTSGVRDVLIRATDKDGTSSLTTSTVVEVTNTGNAPIVNIDGAATGQVGTLVALTGNGADQDQFDIALLTWSWLISKDGVTLLASNDKNISFVPDLIGEYLVTVTVTDPEGLQAQDTHLITVMADSQFVDIFGTSGPDTINVDRLSNGYIRARLNGAIVGVYPPNSNLRIFAENGDDLVHVSNAITRTVEIYGGDGNDILTGGSGNDLISGGAGNDTIAGAVGADFIFGGLGDDTFENRFAEGLFDTYDGGDGFDVIEQNRDFHRFTTFSPTNGIEGLTIINPNNGTRRVQGEGIEDNLLNFSGITHVNGQPISGALGLEIRGLSGSDTIVGTNGHDSIFGGSGDDKLYGGMGNDLLFGDEDADLILGDLGDDTIDGGNGRDVTDGGEGNDVFIANFADHVFDTIIGGAGLNTLRLNPRRNQSDPLQLTNFTPVMRIQRLDGGSRVSGTSDNDTLDFSQVLEWTTGYRIDGGSGDDTIIAPQLTIGFTINGGDGADSITGSLGDDRIDGGTGNDVVSAMSGDDSIRGGAGENSLFGGTGADQFFFHDIIEGRWEQEIRDFEVIDKLKFQWPVNQSLLYGTTPIAGRFVYDLQAQTLYFPNGKRLKLAGVLEDFVLLQEHLSFGTW